MRKCSVQEIIKAVPQVQTLVLPEGWFDHLAPSTDVFNAMYDWMLAGGKVKVDSRYLPGRTYVGEKLYAKLCAAERKRLRAKLKVAGEKLEELLGWSIARFSPKDEIGGAAISGDAIIVIPDSSWDALQDFSVKQSQRNRADVLKKVKARAAGATYYQWLTSQADRQDHVGDTARDALADEHYPRESNDYYELRSYLNEHASDAAIACFVDGWLEYLGQYPGRTSSMAWCSECGKKLDVEQAMLAWSEETGEVYVLDRCCLERYREFDDLDDRPLAGVTRVDLEDLVEKGIGEYSIEQLTVDLRLWGVFPPSDGAGLVYFIQASDTHRIKIGFTGGEVEKRRKTLQTSNAGVLTVLATLKGTVDYEKFLQKRFAAHRLNGEWFEPHPEILAFISVLPKNEEA